MDRTAHRWLACVGLSVSMWSMPMAHVHAQSTVIADDPPPPVAPAVITRNAAGQASVRAIKLTAPLKLDGVLDEEVYQRETSFGGLIQVVPDYGKPETERSEIWITYDDRNIYLSCRCWDSANPDDWVVNELRRDTGGLRNNEHIGVMFDTFHDRRSGFAFYSNPLGARADYSVVDEGGSNTDWNPVWTSKTGRFDGGWTIEMAIPFKSLRYRAGTNQVWGMQIRRSIRHKNEWDYLTPVPQILAGPQALNRVSARRHARGPRPPRNRQEHRDQAIHGRARHDGSRAEATGGRHVRHGGRRRHQVRGHAEPHGGPHRSTPTSRRSRSTSSRTTSRDSASSSRRSASSFSRDAASSISRAAAAGPPAAARPTRHRCSTRGASDSMAAASSRSPRVAG